VGQGRQVSTKASRRDLEKELDIAKAQIAGLKKEIEILREQARSV
jgi:predicted  nucleic acid-binding Zn-ribbon protein